MKFKLEIVLLIVVLFLFPAVIRAQVPPVGRWEIVHMTGDNSAQLALYPGSFSTFLSADGTGYTYGTFTNSICVIDAETFNVVPTWKLLSGGDYEITITVDNLGLGNGNFSFIYTGTYSATTAIPTDSSHTIPAITGTYHARAGDDVSGCSTTTVSTPGTFIATFLPTISSGTATGTLDRMAADNGSAFDVTVSTAITFTAPSVDGQIAGSVSLGTNPTFHSNACFATTAGVVNPLVINPNKSSQSGTSEYIFAEGLDPSGVPTTLFLNGASVNLYTTAFNTNYNATQISTTEWAATAAIGEDYQNDGTLHFAPYPPDLGPTSTSGVSNDGTHTAMAFFYGVMGGVCNDAGGVDAPFQFTSGMPIVHGHRKQKHRGNKLNPKHDHVPARNRK